MTELVTSLVVLAAIVGALLWNYRGRRSHPGIDNNTGTDWVRSL